MKEEAKAVCTVCAVLIYCGTFKLIDKATLWLREKLIGND